MVSCRRRSSSALFLYGVFCSSGRRSHSSARILASSSKDKAGDAALLVVVIDISNKNREYDMAQVLFSGGKLAFLSGQVFPPALLLSCAVLFENNYYQVRTVGAHGFGREKVCSRTRW